MNNANNAWVSTNPDEPKTVSKTVSKEANNPFYPLVKPKKRVLRKIKWLGSRRGLVKAVFDYKIKNDLFETEVAKRLGVSTTTVSRWFNGHSLPRKKTIKRIKELLASAKTVKRKYVRKAKPGFFKRIFCWWR